MPIPVSDPYSSKEEIKNEYETEKRFLSHQQKTYFSDCGKGGYRRSREDIAFAQQNGGIWRENGVGTARRLD